MQTLQKQLSSRLLALVLVAFVFIQVTPTVLALAADISQPFFTDYKVAPGTLVSLDTGKQDYVKPANETDGSQVIGVVAETALLSVDNTSEDSVEVAISGRANALVSNLYGDIKSGDLIAQSPISGIGAKATSGSKVVGVAQSDFSRTSSNGTETTVEQDNGTTSEVYVGSVPIVVAIGQAAGGLGDGQFGGGLKGALSDIAGKQVSSARVIMTGFIFMITTIALIVMIFAAVRHGIVASGRNPLAKPVIFESLIQIMAMIILICVISISMMYAVLRL